MYLNLLVHHDGPITLPVVDDAAYGTEVLLKANCRCVTVGLKNFKDKWFARIDTGSRPRHLEYKEGERPMPVFHLLVFVCVV